MANALHTPGVVDAKAARLDDGGLLALQGPGALDVRTGVLVGPGSTALVAGTSSTSPMRYSIAPHHWVTSRGAANGPYRGTLEATQLADTTPAPGSGSRIDVIWVKQQDNTPGIPTPDGTAAEQYGCTQGTATTGTPTKPSIPVGAVELATATVAAGATSTNGAGVTITQTARQTVARGADIPVRNQAERDALAPFWPLLTVQRLDTGRIERRNAANNAWETIYDPAVKAPALPGIELLRTTASGGNVTLTNSANTAVTFGAGQVQRDVGGFYTGSGAVVATVPAGYAGAYLLGADAEFDASFASRFFVDFIVNGARGRRLSAPSDRAVSGGSPMRLAAGDTIAVQVFQDSGAARNLIKCAISAHLIST